MKWQRIAQKIYEVTPLFYDYQLDFFNGNHLRILKKKLKQIPKEKILEIGCGTAPILKEFHPKTYVGIDIDEKFINIAKKLHRKTNYKFYIKDGRKVETDEEFDMVILSHTTHHFSDLDIKKVLKSLEKIRFKHLVIYDTEPMGLLAPILIKLDLGNYFRKEKDFHSLLNGKYKIIHSETFKSNRPFYKYPLLIISKKQ
ncbi:class I SAM-dependent methyltransferase [Candidatus Parcubacteria bacterium]|nr:MAG: class I SAM-dependent methyltransferase [Candidatus Parcubacteria bacterium]